jgi:hypothetical protein
MSIGRPTYSDLIVCGGRDVAPEMLAAIRADRGVMSVSPDYADSDGIQQHAITTT